MNTINSVPCVRSALNHFQWVYWFLHKREFSDHVPCNLSSNFLHDSQQWILIGQKYFPYSVKNATWRVHWHLYANSSVTSHYFPALKSGYGLSMLCCQIPVWIPNRNSASKFCFVIWSEDKQWDQTAKIYSSYFQTDRQLPASGKWHESSCPCIGLKCPRSLIKRSSLTLDFHAVTTGVCGGHSLSECLSYLRLRPLNTLSLWPQSACMWLPTTSLCQQHLSGSHCLDRVFTTASSVCP